MTQMDDHRWLDTGTGAGYARDCRADQPMTITGPPFVDEHGRLRRAWTYHDLVAEYGESGAVKILATLVDAWEAAPDPHNAPVDLRPVHAALADEIRGTGRALDDC